MDEKRLRDHLKLYLVNRKKFQKRQVGQMKLETLEKHYVEVATQELLSEMKKKSVKRDRDVEISEKEKKIKDSQQAVLAERKKLEEEMKKSSTKQSQKDQYIKLEELVAKQTADVVFQQEVQDDEDEVLNAHIKEVQDFIDDPEEWAYLNVLNEEDLIKPNEDNSSSSRIVTPSNEELRAERLRLEEIKKGVSSKIIGWRFDDNRSAIVVKRADNQCTYFSTTEELMKLKKDDLVQLSKLKMINHGLYGHGYEFESLVKKNAANDFKDYEKNFKRKRSTMLLDTSPLPVLKKKKNEQRARVIGWRMDCTAHEIVIEREDGTEDRLYEDADIRGLSNADLITMNQLPFRDHEDYADGKHFLKVLDFCIECIRDKLR